VEELAAGGGLVLGICNGFQILTEAGLLPGALVRNAGLRFLCQWVKVRVQDATTPFTRACRPGQVLRIPINHYEGNYRPGPSPPRVVLRYLDNPNGSWESVAGVANEAGNVLGMMPHPERACEEWLGSTDGRLILASMVEALRSLDGRGATGAGGVRGRR
jgi:phosphoribosylformylglycinamidine synthase I